MRIAIAGGGVAALEAAIAARNTNADAVITVFAGEKIRPYRRPMLSGLLKGNPVDEKIFFLKPEDFFAANRIELHLDSPVEAITGNALELSDGTLHPFDRLIIATGSKARVPQVPTAPGALVFTLTESESPTRRVSPVKATASRLRLLSASLRTPSIERPIFFVK